MPPADFDRRARIIITLASLLCPLTAGALSALEPLERLRPGLFGAAPASGPAVFDSPCTYATLNGTLVEDGRISIARDGQAGFTMSMRTPSTEVAASTANGLVYREVRYRCEAPGMSQAWGYDTRTSRTSARGGEYYADGTQEKNGAVVRRVSAALGPCPLESDLLGLQLAALLARGVRDFNADFLVKNRWMKVNADFRLERVDRARIDTLLAEAGPFRAGLAAVLQPGCLVYSVKLTGLPGALFKGSIQAAFTDGPTPGFLAYWNTNPSEREGIWLKPAP